MTGRLLLAVVVCFLVSYCHAVPMRHGDDGLFTELREKRGGGGQCPNPGCKGQKGAKGPPGQQGQRGYTGHRGQQGQCDASYCLWFLKNNMPTPPPPPQDPPMGLPGMKGEPGEPGPKGDPGVPGSKGLPGMPGRPGSDGEKGDSGVPGEPGNPGRKGLPGPEGPPGMNGDPGLTGERGRKGIAGDPGEPGADGPPGRTGVPGKEGLPGIPGAPGEPGRNGTDGMKGERGLPGPPIEVIPRLDSEPCTEELQGVIRFDPDEKRLYFCDGMKWVCIQSMDCGGAPTCSSPFGAQNIGDQWYQVFARNVTAETQDAADIVLVIDDSGSMNREHAWLLIMVPLLEQTLISAGVGDGADVRNRYCAVAFGGFPNDREAGHFLPVNGEPCFFASDFPIAQAQLQNAGLREDGWEAIQFALDNIPFRESPFIAKNIILITDEGRTPIPQGENITREGLEAELKSNDILLNVVVWADYEVTNKPDEVVIGVDAKGNSYLLRPNGTFATTTDPVVVTQAEGDTADVYVDLALDVTGAAWALRVLRESSIDQNIEIQQSFTSAIAEVKLREIRATIESCRRCTCVAGLEEGTTVSDCTIAEDEPFCRCVVENKGNAGECVRTSVEEVPEGEGPEEPGPVGLIRSENFLQLDDAPSEK